MKLLRLLALLTMATLCSAQKQYEKTSVPPPLPVYYSQSYPTLQALSDAVPSAGGTMVISAGNYTVSTVITLKSNTIVQCLPGATLYMSDAGAVVANHWIFANVNYTATSLTDSSIRIRDCAFNGNSATPSTGADAIRMVFVSDVEVSGNSFTGFGDATAFLGTTRSLVQNNKATNITNTCFDTWYASSYFRILNNYCETKKHGIQVTGTDTAQSSAGIAGPGKIRDNDIVLFSSGAVGAGIYLNSGASSDTGAGAAHVSIRGGRITTSGLGASVGDCIKVAGSGSTNDWIAEVLCDNGYIYVGPADSLATSYPANIHIRDSSINITNTYADGAAQIKTGTSDIEGSRITGGGYAYCINLIGATNQAARNNSCVDGTDGSNPRINTDGTSSATAQTTDTNETGSTPVTTSSGEFFSTTNFRSPTYTIGTASNGQLAHAGSDKIVLDALINGTGILALRTNSGSGAVDRLVIRNNGDIQIGAADAAAPTARTVVTQGARGGTDTNTAGANLTIQSGLGTGSATGSTITFQTPRVGSSGTTAETATNALLLGPTAISIGNATSNPTITLLGSGALSGTPLTTFMTAPGPIGSGTPSSGAFTTLTSSSGMPLSSLATQATNTVAGNATSGTAVPTALAVGTCSTSASALIWTTNTGFGCNTSVNAATLGGATFAAPGSIGSGTAAAGAFTTLTASSTVSGAGFDAYLASPPAIGGTARGAGSFTTLSANSSLTVTGGTNINASNNNSTNIGTGTTSSTVTIGGGSNAVTLNATTLTLTGGTLVTSGSPFTMSNQTVKMTGITTGTNADTVCLSSTGVVLIQAAACTISSLRFKKDVATVRAATMPKIAQLRVASFRMKDGERNRDPNGAGAQVGLIAENIASIAPECAIYEQDMKTPKSFRQECVIALMVKAMQEQQGEIRELKARLRAH